MFHRIGASHRTLLLAATAKDVAAFFGVAAEPSSTLCFSLLRHFQVVAALFAREPVDSRRDSVAAPSMGCRFVTSIGMATHTSVPAPVLLQTANLALMFSARSRIPRRPQCESHSLRTVSGLIPQQLSRT